MLNKEAEVKKRVRIKVAPVIHLAEPPKHHNSNVQYEFRSLLAGHTFKYLRVAATGNVAAYSHRVT